MMFYCILKKDRNSDPPVGGHVTLMQRVDTDFLIYTNQLNPCYPRSHIAAYQLIRISYFIFIVIDDDRNFCPETVNMIFAFLWYAFTITNANPLNALRDFLFENGVKSVCIPLSKAAISASPSILKFRRLFP